MTRSMFKRLGEHFNKIDQSDLNEVEQNIKREDTRKRKISDFHHKYDKSAIDKYGNILEYNKEKISNDTRSGDGYHKRDKQNRDNARYLDCFTSLESGEKARKTK